MIIWSTSHGPVSTPIKAIIGGNHHLCEAHQHSSSTARYRSPSTRNRSDRSSECLICCYQPRVYASVCVCVTRRPLALIGHRRVVSAPLNWANNLCSPDPAASISHPTATDLPTLRPDPWDYCTGGYRAMTVVFYFYVIFGSLLFTFSSILLITVIVQFRLREKYSVFSGMCCCLHQIKWLLKYICLCRVERIKLFKNSLRLYSSLLP